MNNTFLLFYSPNFRAKYGYRKWSIKESFCDDRFWPSNHKSGKISEKRIRATSSCEQQGGKLTLQLAWLAGKELVTVPRYQDLLQLENRTALKLGLQQFFNLQLADVNHTYMRIQNVTESYKHVNPQCKSKNRDNSAVFILTDQLITTSQNK